jgi:hypothetical protein
MWWEPTLDQFSELKDPSAPIHGLGKLSEAKLQELKDSVSVLFSRFQAYMSNLCLSQAPPSLGPMVNMIEHGLARLESVWTNFRRVAFGVRDVQRCWLDVTAMLDYMEIYKPRMDSALAVNSLPEKVADTVGIFTNDIRTAQDFFRAGLPCWLIRPSSVFGTTNILDVAPLQAPDNYLILRPHFFNYPVVFEGPATSSQKYHAILNFARNFLHYPDPFNCSITDKGTSTLPQASPSSAGSHTLAGGPGTTSTSGSSRRRNAGLGQANKSKVNTPYRHWGSVVRKYMFISLV